MTMIQPPLELAVEVTDANGVRSRWDSGDKIAGNRPQNLGFGTKRGDGFSEGSVTLARRIDRDYIDLNLFDDVAFIGADGSIAYEGRVAAQPRSFDDAHSISVNLAGWMSHARDQPFTGVFVDRDLGAWQAPSRTRQAAIVAGNATLHDFVAARDNTNLFPALVLSITGAWISPYAPFAEALYDAGAGNTVNVLYFWTQQTNLDPSFNLWIQGGTGDASYDVSTSDLFSGADFAGYQSMASPRQFAALTFSYAATPGGADGASYTMGLRNLAVYGDQYPVLSLIGDDPKGYAASDVMRNIASRFCPKLNLAGITDSAYPIPHLAFKDQTDPYDAFLELNKYHLWELGVWEDKTLTFGPSDRSDYDWVVRLSDFGVKVDLQGDSTEDLANGIIVEYQDVATGSKRSITPAINAALADPDPDNPVNAHGLTKWTKLSLSSPTTGDAAVQIGRTALIEFNQPKAPGTINVTGHLRDRAGHWQQGWKVRAGDTIAITDHPNSAPRLITETSWNHDSKQLTVTVDGTNKRLDATLDRVNTALIAAGLT